MQFYHGELANIYKYFANNMILSLLILKTILYILKQSKFKNIQLHIAYIRILILRLSNFYIKLCIV